MNRILLVAALLAALAAASPDEAHEHSYMFLGKMLRGFQSGVLGQQVDQCLLFTDDAAKEEFTAIMQTIESMTGANTIGEVYAFAQQQILPFLATHVYSQCQFDVSTRLIMQNCQENENCLPHYLVRNAAAHSSKIAELFQAFHEDHQTTLKAYDAGALFSHIVFSAWPPATQIA